MTKTAKTIARIRGLIRICSLCRDNSRRKIPRMRRLSTYATLLLLAPAALAAQQHSPDLVLVNGRVHTVDLTRPLASAIAVRAGRIVFVGSDSEARALTGSATRVVDLK